jgi:phage-related protein (TIGR01555 family)
MTFQFKNLIQDSFSSLMTGLGIPGRDKSISMIPTIDTVAYNLKHLEALYRGNWLAKKIVDIPAFDATRAWRTWNAEKEEIQKIEKTERDFGIQRKVLQALIKSRLYGGAALVIGVKGSHLNKELKSSDVGRGDLQWVHVVEKWMLQAGPLVRDITSPWFGEPSYYMRSNTVTTPPPGNVDPIPESSLGYSPGETIYIHPSRVVRLVGTEYPDMEVAYDAWGDSVLTNVYEAIRDAGLVTASLANMIADAKVDVFKIPGLTSTLSTTEGTNKMLGYLSGVNVAKSVVNALVLDKEIDWERIETNFESLDKVLQAYLLIAAAAADIPSTRLLSREPAGMNSTGDSDSRNYYDRVAADQTVRMTPLLNRLDEVLLRHTFGRRDPEWTYSWEPLWQMSDTEKADITLKKAQAFQIDVNSALIPAEALVKGRENQLIEDGVYPGLDVAIDDLENNWEEDVQFLPHAQMEQSQNQFETTQENFQANAQAAKQGNDQPDNDNDKAKAKTKTKAKAQDAARRVAVMDRHLYPSHYRVTPLADGSFRFEPVHDIGWTEEARQASIEARKAGAKTPEAAPHERHEIDVGKVMKERLATSKYAYYARATRIHAYERSAREKNQREAGIIAAYHSEGEQAKKFLNESVSHAVLRHVIDTFKASRLGVHAVGLAEDVTITHVLLPVLEVGLVAALTELGAPVVAATAGVEVAHYAAQYLVDHSALSPEHCVALLSHASTALLGAWQKFKSADSLMQDAENYDNQIRALQRLVAVLATFSFDEDGKLTISTPTADEQSALGFEVAQTSQAEAGKARARKRRRPFDPVTYPRFDDDAAPDFTQDPSTGRFTGSVGHGGGSAPAVSQYGLVPGDVAKYKALKNQWAQVNNGLLAYVDKPDSPEAREKLGELEGLVKQMQVLHADPGTTEGIGLPGGPRDVVIVGAGPGGLAASINGAAEGLDTLVIEANAVAGGQAKFSSRIENFPGFPVGVTGQHLTQDMFVQAQRLGAEATLGTRVTAMTYDATTGLKHLTLSNGQHVDSRTVILAGGVEFRHMAFPGSEGSGIFVGDGKALAAAGTGGSVVVIGGSNGAAQAALGCAQSAQHVYLLARHPIADSMSDYQISALKNNPKVTVIESDSIVKMFRDQHGNPESIETAKGQRLPVKALGEFLGSVPDARWLPANIPLAKGGRVPTNAGLETPIPGVYAIGDMRDGAIGRVGVAVGEGQFALREANMFLAKQKKPQTDAVPVKADKTTLDLITRLFALDRDNPWFGQTVEGVPPPKKHAGLRDADPRTLYVRRDVLNADEIIVWAKAQGFTTTLPADDMHVTVAFSKQPVDWMKAGEVWGDGELTVQPGGARLLERFGPDKDCVVLLFNSDALRWRHDHFKEIGASWDWPEYQPHITISYKVPVDLDLDSIEPYRGEIKLGPEIFEQVKENWHASIQEDAEYVEEQHPRGEHGMWTQGSGTEAQEFVSPNTTQLSFP